MAISIMVNWRSYGPGKTYNLYYSLQKNYGFVKANGSPIADNSSGNSFEITGAFALDKEYWVYVVEHLNGIDIPESIIGYNSDNTFPILNKVCVRTY